MASLAVAVGAHLTPNDSAAYFGLLVAAIAAFLICAAGNVVNDLFDIETDRINHPNRVLVRGGFSARFAVRMAVGLNAIALVMALAISWLLAVVAAATIGLLYTYSWRLKRILLVGNLTLAVLAGMTFLAGGLAVAPEAALSLPGPLIPAVFAFLLHLVREILKDVQDMEGDRRPGIDSLPLAIGTSKALLAALILFFALVLASFVPVWAGWFGRTYHILTVYVLDLPLLALLIICWGFPTPRVLAITAMALKVGMAVGLIAFMDW